MGFIAPILSAIGIGGSTAAILGAGAELAMAGSMLKGGGGAPSTQVPEALNQQAQTVQAPPTQESVVGNDAEIVLNRIRARRGAVGLQQTNVTGGVTGAAPVAKAGLGVSTGSTPMAQQNSGGYTGQKKLVGE